MKRAVLLLACLGLSACGGGSQRAQEAAPAAAAPAPAAAVAKPLTAGWTATTGIMTPESAFYDAASGFIFSSQINGAPDAKDGNGSIAKLDGDGTVVKADFVSGLNAPKGLRVCNGTLWAADLGEVLAIDVATGAIKSRVAIPESMFLNDVACAGDVAYVTDMMGNKIFKVENNAATVAAEGAELEFPNGLATKKKTLITPKPTANIDGLESDGKGGYLVTDYIAGTLMHISANGESKVIRTLKPGSADIGYVGDKAIVIVPMMNDNSVIAYDISADLK